MKSLNLSSTPVQGLTKLTGLNLSGTRVTDAGLAHLKHLSGSLENLDLQKTIITDAGLERLHGLSQLQHLNLNGTAVSSDGVAKLQKAIPKLKAQL